MQWNKFGLIILGLAVTGCASAKPSIDTHTSGFGEAVKQNIASQRIAPTAEDKANTFIPPNHARQKAARQAYENGTVKEPIPIGTTE